MYTPNLMPLNRPRRVLAACALVAGFGLTCASAADVPERTPRAGRTLVVSRGQMKYGLEANYLHRWVDRPLFQDSALRTEDKRIGPTTYDSYARMVAIARAYGLDGFAFFPETSGRMAIYDFAAKAHPEGFGLLPEFISSRDMAKKHAMLEAALACPPVLRLDGRIPVTAYRSESLSPADWRGILDEMRTRHGDAFIFFPDLSRPWGGLIEKYAVEGGIGTAELDEVKAYLRSYLDVFDGLYFAAAAAIKRDRRFREDFYRDVLIAAFTSVLAEPAYREKYFALSACIGHENCTRLGYTLSSEGTRTLRASLEAALDARPDLVVLPEWDEQNENTSFRPTVCNSFSTQRILAWWMRKLKGEPAASNPGDDLSVPNLVLSYRKMLSLGEVLEVELLYIPDSETASRPCVATLSLKDPQGRIVHQFAPATLRTDTLHAHTFVVPSEELSGCTAVRPVLTVSREDGVAPRTFEDGLHHIQLRATWNWDYKWIKIPLRDLCKPVAANFSLRVADGGLEATGRVTSSETIASVEILRDATEVFALGPDAADAPHRLAIELRSFRRKRMRGTFELRGPGCTWRSSRREVEEAVLRVNENVDWARRVLYATVPPEAFAAAPVLDVDIDIIKTTVPLAEVRELGVWSRTYDDGLTLTLRYPGELPDHPLHLDTTEAEFTTILPPDTEHSVYSMRVITKTGRIYCGPPVVNPNAVRGDSVPLRVWSDSGAQPVTVAVDGGRIPIIDYVFEPRRGSALYTAAGRHLLGHLGGYTDSVTARGGDGGRDGTPFVNLSNYPQNATVMAPSWQEAGGVPCLAFDGTGTFIALPQGVLPRRGSFTLTFDILPRDVAKPQVLFAHHGNYIGSLVVRLENGLLSGSFVDEKLRRTMFHTDLAVEAGRWNRVEVVYDLSAMHLRVNESERKSFACAGPGLYDTTSVFGGFGGSTASEIDFVGNPGWFAGLLRSLRVVHTADVAVLKPRP